MSHFNRYVSPWQMGQFLQGDAHPGLEAGRPIYFQLNGFDLTRELQGSTRELRDTNGIGGTYASYVRTYMAYLSELGFDIREGVDPRGGQETVYFRDNSDGPIADIYEGSNASRGETIINLSDSVFDNASQAFRRRYEMVMHEINHALGLRDSVDVALELSNGEHELVAWNDDKLLTNMSYNRFDAWGSIDRVGNATLMPADYYGLMDMYGHSERVDAHQGRTVLGFNTNIRHEIWANMAANMNSNNTDRHWRYFYTDYAPGDNDVVDMSGMSHGIQLNLNPIKPDDRAGRNNWSNIKYGHTDHRFADLGFSRRSIFEIAIGSDFNDTLIANAADNHLYGGEGNDRLVSGFGGHNALEGGEGHDTYYVRLSRNRDYAMDSSFQIIEREGEGRDTIHILTSYQQGDRGFAVDIPENVENLIYNDNISKIRGNDLGNKITLDRRAASGMYINGYGGNDEIEGSSHRDFILGGDGVDALEGADGFDTLVGGRGEDHLIGGRDWDVFRYNSISDSTADEFDKIYDFERGSLRSRRGDKIDLRNIVSWTEKPTKQWSKHLQFIGDDKFSHQRGEIRFADGFIEVNTDSDWDVEMRIYVDGQQRMFASDFMTGEW